MKVIAKIRAFYNGTIVRVGEQIEFKGKKCPSWAEKVGDKEEEKKEEKIDEVVEENNSSVVDVPVDVVPVYDTVEEDVVSQDAAEDDDDAELAKIADELLTKAIENGITIDTENKTVKEIVEELQEVLKEVE